MATDDKQILVAGQADAPAHWTVPGNGQIQPKCVRAVYDGSGAGGAFLPVLRFISDGGVTVGEFVGDEIAAGASASVSWFPHVGGQAAAAATGLSWAYMSRNNTFTVNASHQGAINPDLSSFYTTDPATFGASQDIFTGQAGIFYKKFGHYLRCLWVYQPVGFVATEYEIELLHERAQGHAFPGGFPGILTTAASRQSETTVTWLDVAAVASANTTVPTSFENFQLNNFGPNNATFVLGSIVYIALDAVDKDFAP